MEENFKDRLKDIVINGINSDLLDIIAATSLCEVISNNKEKITENYFEHLFGTLQILLSKNIIISLTKLFDKNDKHKMKNIKGAIKILRENAENFEIINRESLESKLTIWGFNEQDFTEFPDVDLTKFICEKIELKFPSENDWNKIKTIRDKRIAHNDENIQDIEIPSITWETIENPIETIKMIVMILGNHYLEIYYEADGKYMLSDASLEVSRALERLLTHLPEEFN